MSALFKKPSAGDEQMSRIQRQVEAMGPGIRYLSTHLPQKTLTAVNEASAGTATVMNRAPSARDATRPAGGPPRQDRLPDLLSGGVASARRGADARRLTTHRALVIGVFMAAVVFWVIARCG